MVINFDEKSDKCNFEHCRNNEEGSCRSEDERGLCVEMALEMLGVRDANIAEKGHKGESDL